MCDAQFAHTHESCVALPNSNFLARKAQNASSAGNLGEHVISGLLESEAHAKALFLDSSQS